MKRFFSASLLFPFFEHFFLFFFSFLFFSFSFFVTKLVLGFRVWGKYPFKCSFTCCCARWHFKRGKLCHLSTLRARTRTVRKPKRRRRRWLWSGRRRCTPHRSSLRRLAAKEAEAEEDAWELAREELALFPSTRDKIILFRQFYSKTSSSSGDEERDDDERHLSPGRGKRSSSRILF